MPETLLVAVAGILVVIAELAVITVIILGISKIMRSIEGKLTDKGAEAPENNEVLLAEGFWHNGDVPPHGHCAGKGPGTALLAGHHYHLSRGG